MPQFNFYFVSNSASLFAVIGILIVVGSKWNPKISKLDDEIVTLQASYKSAKNETEAWKITSIEQTSEIERLRQEMKFFMSDEQAIMVIASSYQNSLYYLIKPNGGKLDLTKYIMEEPEQINGRPYLVNSISAIIRGEMFIFGGIDDSSRRVWFRKYA